MASIYVAGKDMVRARKVMSALRDTGHEIIYDWVALFNTGPSPEKARAEWEGVRNADILVYLWEPDQESARYEAGMAMGLEKILIVSGKADAFFFQLPHVHVVSSDDEIPKKLKEFNV